MTVSMGAKIFAAVIAAIIFIGVLVVIILLVTHGHDVETVTTKNPSSSGLNGNGNSNSNTQSATQTGTTSTVTPEVCTNDCLDCEFVGQTCQLVPGTRCSFKCMDKTPDDNTELLLPLDTTNHQCCHGLCNLIICPICLQPPFWKCVDECVKAKPVENGEKACQPFCSKLFYSTGGVESCIEDCKAPNEFTNEVCGFTTKNSSFSGATRGTPTTPTTAPNVSPKATTKNPSSIGSNSNGNSNSSTQSATQTGTSPPHIIQKNIVRLKNNWNRTISGTIIYQTFLCSNDDYELGPRETFANGRGGCLIDKITGNGDGLYCTSYVSSMGTAYSNFYITGYRYKCKITRDPHW